MHWQTLFSEKSWFKNYNRSILVVCGDSVSFVNYTTSIYHSSSLGELKEMVENDFPKILRCFNYRTLSKNTDKTFFIPFSIKSNYLDNNS